MTCTISLGPADDFILTTPEGRKVSIPVSPHGIKELWQVLWNASAERAPAAGLSLARQRDNERRAAWDKVEADNAAWNQAKAAEAEARRLRRLEAREAKSTAAKIMDKFGFDIATLEFEI